MADKPELELVSLFATDEEGTNDQTVSHPADEDGLPTVENLGPRWDQLMDILDR